MGFPKGVFWGRYFIIFMNELPECIKHCKFGLYADDTVLVNASKKTNDIKDILQQHLTLVYKWLTLNQLHLNVKKTK